MSLSSDFTPDFSHEGKGRGIVFLEFGPHEGIEIIHAEVGFGHLGEEFLVVGSGIVAGLATTEKKHSFVKTLLFRSFVGLENFRVLEAEYLVVISMSQFMKDDVRVLGPGTPGEKTTGSRYVYAFFQSGVVSVGLEPGLGRMVLHVSQLVLEVDANGQFAQSRGFLRW